MASDERRLGGYGERIFQLLVDAAEDYGMCALDPQGRIVRWNVGAARTYGYREDEVIGRSIDLIFTEQDRQAGVPLRELRDAEAQGRSEDERWHVRKDGSRLWAHGVLVPVREKDGTLLGFGKITRDRTDLKELQDALHHHSVELQRANEEKSVFLATLAHELRNPLSVLTQCAALLEGNAPVERVRLAQMIGRQLEFTKRLVDDLMDIVRIGRGKLPIQCTRLDLRDVVSRAVEMVQPDAQSRNVDLRISVPDLPLVISGDASRLLQVLANLLTNAVKFSGAGQRITVVATSEANEAVTRVSDEGAGIPPEELVAIFDLFSQAHGDWPGAEAGVGIGLALTRDLVMLHGGTIQARSEGLKKGSEFIVRLPLAEGAQSITAPPSAA